MIYLSWSMLRAHEDCRQKSYLIRSGKRSPAKNLRNYFHGMVVDSVMRTWLSNGDPQPGQMEPMVDAMFDETERNARESGDGIVRWRHRADRDDVRQFCLELVRRLEPILIERVLPHEYQPARNFKVEATIPLGEGITAPVTLRGEMDLLLRENGTDWKVWDLKGTADDHYWRKVLGQLVFYDLAVMLLFGSRTTSVGLIQPMCTNPILEFTISDDDRRAMWERIIRMATDIYKNNNECKDGTAGCSWCEVNHACPRYTASDSTFTLAAGLLTEAQRTEKSS